MADIVTVFWRVISAALLSMQHLQAGEIALFALPFVCAAFVPRAPLRAFAPLLLLPAIWISLLIWAAVFWTSKPHETSFWLTLPLALAHPLFLALTLVLVWRLPDLRVVTVAFAAANLSFLIRANFLAGMAVTGSWL